MSRECAGNEPGECARLAGTAVKRAMPAAESRAAQVTQSPPVLSAGWCRDGVEMATREGGEMFCAGETQGSTLSISGRSGCRDRMAALAHTLHSRTQRDQTERQMPGLYSGKYENLPTNLRPQLTVRPRAQLLKRQPRRGNHPHVTDLYSKCSSLFDTAADRQHAMGRRLLRGQ